MLSSPAVYHGFMDWLFGLPPHELDELREIWTATIEVLETCQFDGELVSPGALPGLKHELELIEEEETRRQDRIRRLGEDPLNIPSLASHAVNILARLPIDRYIGSEMPWVGLVREGRRITCRCVFLGCEGTGATLTIYDGDFAWCASCDRGGNLFTVIGLCEAIERPDYLIRRAAEIAGYDLPAGSQHRSLTSNSYREEAVSERLRVNRRRPTGSVIPRLSGGKVVAS